MQDSHIVVRGAREHNLKNINVSIPRNTLTVITGVSGSGKSSLAFDTIYAEGQRRYVESLSAYARQFLGLMEKPDIDHIEGLSPAISIDQKGVSRNPRSTVGTVTEIYDYLRLLFARAGRPHCPKCGRSVSRQTVQQIVDAILRLPENSRAMLLAPVITHMKGEHRSVFKSARSKGFARVRVDGNIFQLEEDITLDKNKWHNIQIVVDRISIHPKTDKGRITDSVEAALNLADGNLTVLLVGEGKKTKDRAIPFSERFACVHCSISISELEPRNFSFNTPYGACAGCTGLGFRMEVDPLLVVQDEAMTLRGGAITAWRSAGAMPSWHASTLESLAKTFEFSLDVPFAELTDEMKKLILYGAPDAQFDMSHTTKNGQTYSWRRNFEGVLPNLERRYAETESQASKEDIERFMSQHACATCKGERLKPESLAVTVLGMNIIQVTRQTVESSLRWVQACRSGEWTADNGTTPAKNATDPLSERELSIARQILNEVEARLGFLERVGLNYLSLDRSAATLSGGEGQRIRLATQIGSGLVGVLYVCDEPSVGLHPADNSRLIETLQSLRNVGNTVLIVEHDEAVMRAADHIVDLGPGAGVHGGNLVAEGSLDHIIAIPESLTGAYLSGRKTIPIPEKRRRARRGSVNVVGATANNLSNIDVSFPLGRLICVTGVSGSGKSTLVNEILNKALMQKFYRAKDRPGGHRGILGVERIDKVINIDQSPIGRTPRSNPATYTGAFTHIREIFASTPEARARGYKPGRFSFNVKGGRCEACSGAGHVQIEMQFLPNVTVPCEVCKGQRYNREASEIFFKGKTIAQVLDMTVDEGATLFENIPPIRNKLNTLKDVGLGYIGLGQPATTLSGGEAQRIKLASELSKRSTGRTLYILDEPTTGLSFYDCAKLVEVLHKLVEVGNTVVLIEHHLDFIKNADWIIDLGPGAGMGGGELVAIGEPEFIASVKTSATGRYLRQVPGIEPDASANGEMFKLTRDGKIKQPPNSRKTLSKEKSAKAAT